VNSAPGTRVRIGLAAWLAVLLLPDLVSCFAAAGDAWTDGRASRLLLAGALTLALLGVVRRVRTFVWLTLPFAVLAPIEALYVARYGAPTSAAVVAVVAETGAAEAMEFLRSNLPMLVAAPLAVAAASAWLLREARGVVVAGAMVRRLSLVGLLSFAGVALAFTQLPHDARAPDAAVLDEDLWRSEGLLTPETAWIAAVYPWGVPLRVADYSVRLARTPAALKELEGFRFGATLDETAAPRNIVLVIGESARADRFGVNGYARATTPTLSADPAWTSFADAVSAAASTRSSLPFLLTRMRPGTRHFGPPPERSIVSAFREAGYRTWWLSNQQPSALENSIAFFAREANASAFVNRGSFTDRGEYDEALLPLLDAALRDAAPRRLIVLHTLGSHWHYQRRYPPAFEVFTPASGDGVVSTARNGASIEAIRNAYDNSIRYTDWLLGEVAARLRATSDDAAIVYVSDHGESLHEGRCALFGHGVASAANFHVPLLVWLSPSLAARRPALVAALRGNAGAPVSSESVFPTLAQLGGLRMADAKTRLSLASDRLERGPRLVSRDGDEWRDYDRQLPEVDCATPPAPR
jgi:glucan phosphoethanolaminetransferase (alkaline phosphatase superfamily)